MAAQRIPGTGQVIIRLVGEQLFVEAAGVGGATRTKIEGVTFNDLPLAIRASLKEQQIIQRQPEIPLPPREDPEIVKARRLAEAREAHKREWETYLSTLTPKAREEALAKRDAKLAKQAEDEAERSRQVWLMTATEHDVQLANRVITDPNRRPRRKVIVINGDGTRIELSPRQIEKTKSGKKVDLSLALDIDL